MNKILVIDDDDSVNELVKINLELAGYEVYTAKDGINGFATAKQEKPDLIVLDVMMPDVDGYTVAKRIRENEDIKDIPIIMLTALGMLEDKVKGFDIGVDDYLVKPFEIDELKVRVRALLKRTDKMPKSATTKEVLQRGDITLIPETYSVKINQQMVKITPIEFDIVNLLMQNYGNMVSGAKILTEIWGYNPDDDVETIRVHIRHIRTKLDKISGDKQYIETIYGGGYRLVPEGVAKKKK
jgi:two-component system response regulator RpaA